MLPSRQIVSWTALVLADVRKRDGDERAPVTGGILGAHVDGVGAKRLLRRPILSVPVPVPVAVPVAGDGLGFDLAPWGYKAGHALATAEEGSTEVMDLALGIRSTVGGTSEVVRDIDGVLKQL